MTPNEEKRVTKPNETDEWTKKWHGVNADFLKHTRSVARDCLFGPGHSNPT